MDFTAYQENFSYPTLYHSKNSPTKSVYALSISSSFSFRYFQCEPNFGLFAPLHKVVLSSLPLPARLQNQTQQENDARKSLGTLGSNSSLSSTTSPQSVSSPTPKPTSTSTSQVMLRHRLGHYWHLSSCATLV